MTPDYLRSEALRIERGGPISRPDLCLLLRSAYNRIAELEAIAAARIEEVRQSNRDLDFEMRREPR